MMKISKTVLTTLIRDIPRDSEQRAGGEEKSTKAKYDKVALF
jgi:hypothetical protein